MIVNSFGRYLARTVHDHEGGENVSPRPVRPRDGIETSRPGRPATRPIATGSSPAPVSAPVAARSSSGETTTQNPMPMLKVAYIVAAATGPAPAMSPNTGGS